MPPPEECGATDTQYLAALVEDHLRDAVAHTREAYGPDMPFEAARWLYLEVTEVLGLPEHLVYPTIDRVEDYLLWTAHPAGGRA